MRVLSVFIAGLMIIFPNGSLYAEVVLDKPMPIVSGARNLRTPQQIIADFQATVEKIQSEQQTLYTQIEMKNKENALLLKKLNDMTSRMTLLEEQLESKSSESGDALERVRDSLIQEKNEIQSKYDQVLEEKSLLEQKIKDLKDQRQTLAMAEQESLTKLQNALDASEAKVREQQATIDALTQEKNYLDSNRLEVIGEKEEIEQQLADLKDQLAEAKQKEEQKPENNQAPLQLRIRELSDDLDRMENEIRAKDTAIARYKSQAVKAENDLKRALAEKENSRTQIQKLTSTYNAAQDGRSEKIARLEKKLVEAQEETKRFSQESAEAKENLLKSQAEQKSLTKKIEVLKTELSKTTATAEAKIKEANAPLISQIDALQKVLDATKNDTESRVKLLNDSKAKIAALTEQVRGLKAERDSLQSSLHALELKRETANPGPGQTQDQTKKLRMDLASRDRELDQKSQTIEELVKEKNALVSQVSELEKVKVELESRLDKLQNSALRTESEGRESGASREVRNLEEKVEKLTRTLKDQEKDIKDKDLVIKQLKDRQADASLKLSSAEDQKKTLQVMINSLESQLGNTPLGLRRAIRDRRFQIAELKGELKARIDDSKEAKLNIEKLDKLLSEERKQREIAQKDAAVMQERIKTQEAILDTRIAAKTDPLHETIAKLNAQIKEQTEEVESKDRALNELRDQKEKVEENLIDSNNERKLLEDRVADLESRLSRDKDSGPSGKADEGSESELKRKWNEAVEQLAQKDKTIQEYREKSDRLENSINSLNQEKAQESQSIQKLTTELDRLQKESREKLVSVREELEKRILDAQESAAQAQSSLRAKESEISALNIKVSGLEKEISDLSRKNTDLLKTSSLGVVVPTADEAKRNLPNKETNALRNKIAQLEKDRNEYLAQIKRMTGDSDRLKKELQEARRRQEQLTQSMEQSAKQNEAAAESSSAQKAELEGKIADLMNRNQASEKQLNELRSQLAQAEKNSKTSGIDTSKEWKTKYDQASRELSAALENVKLQEKRTNELKARNDQLEVSVVSVKDQVVKKGKDLSQALVQVDELTSQVEILTKDRVNLDQRVKDLTQQVVTLQASRSGEITNVKSEATQKTADLAMKLADAVGQIQTSDLKIQQLTDKQKRLEEQLASANSLKDQNQEQVQKSIKEIDLQRKNYEQQIEQLKQEALRFGNERDAQVMKVNELENAIKDNEKAYQDKQAGFADEITKLRGLLTEKDAEMKQSRQRVSDLEKIKEAADVQLAGAIAREKELSEKLDAAQSSLSGQTARNQQEAATLDKELREKIADLSGQLEIALDEAGELKRSKSALEEGIAAKDKSIEDLQTRLKDAEKRFEEKNAQPDLRTVGVQGQLQSEIEKLKAELKITQESVKEMSRQKANVDDDLKVSQAKVQELESRMAESQKSMESSRAQLAQEIADAKKQIKQLTDDLEASQKAVDELLEGKISLENDLKAQKAVVAQLESEKEEQVKALTSTKTQLSDEAMNLQKTLESRIKELSVQLKDSQDAVRDVQAKNQNLEKANGQMSEQLAVLQTKEKEYQEKLQSAQVRIADQESKGREAASAIEKELNARIDEAAVQLTAAKNETALVQKAKEALESELKQRDRTIDELQTSLSEKEKSWQESESMASRETAEIKTAMSAQIQQLREEVQKSQKTIEELTRAKTGLEGGLDTSEGKVVQLQAVIAEKDKALESSREKMSRELADVKSSLQSQVDRLTVELKESQQAHSELAKAKAVLEEQFVVVDKKAAQLSTEVEQRQNEFVSYKEKSLQDIDQTRAGMQSEIDRLRADLDKERQTAQELSAAKSELQDRAQTAQARIEELQKLAEQKQQALDSAKAQAEQENAELKSSLQAQIDRLSTDLKEAQGAVEDLTQAKKQLSEDIAHAEKQIAQLTDQLQTKESELAVVAAKSQQELAEKEKIFSDQLTGLKNELSQTKDQLSQMSESKDGLAKELKSALQKADSLSSDLAAKTKELSDLSTSVPEQVMAAKKPLEDKLTVMGKSLEEAQGELKNKQAAADDLSKTIAGLEKTLSDTTSARDKAQKESVAVREDLDAARKEMTAKIDEARKELSEKNVSLENALAAKEKEVEALNQEKENLSAQLKQLTADKDKLTKEATVLKASIEDHEKSLEKKIDIAKQPLLEELGKLQKMLEEKEQLIEQKAEAFTKLSGELTTVLKGLAVVREERDNLSLRVKPLELQVSGIPNEVAQAKKPLEDENAKLRLELEKVQGMLDVRVQGLEADLEERNAAYNDSVASRRSLEKDVERLKQESEKLSQENQRMELKLSKKFQEDCGVAMEELQKPWKDKIEELKVLLDGRDKEIESFKNENARLNQELGSPTLSSN